MNNPEYFKQKLFVTRDVERKPNVRALAEVRKLQEELEKYPGFIGAALFGSTVKGYSTEISDVDMKILLDPEKFTSDKEFNALLAGIEALRRSALRGADLIVEYIDPPDIIKDLHNNEDELGVELVGEQLADLLWPITGRRIEEYRALFAREIKSLSPDKQSLVFKSMLEKILVDDKAKEKRATRLGLKSRKENEIVKARKELWKKRINSMFFA